MFELLAAVFIASVLGSLHCAGMCGPFAALVAGDGQGAPLPRGSVRLRIARQSAFAQLPYHAGRLVVYGALGALAGAIGAAVDLGGTLVGMQRAAAILAGALMIALGVSECLRMAGMHVPAIAASGGVRAIATRAFQRVALLPRWLRALCIGLLTTLIPCGWLYAFVITAGGTASPVAGLLAMIAFWAGTLPILVLVGVGAGAIRARSRGWLRGAMPVALVAIGLLTVSGRMSVSPDALRSVVRRPNGVGDAAMQISALKSDHMPCCVTEGTK